MLTTQPRGAALTKSCLPETEGMLAPYIREQSDSSGRNANVPQQRNERISKKHEHRLTTALKHLEAARCFHFTMYER